MQLDTSDLIVNWINESGYSLIDVNILNALPDLPPKVNYFVRLNLKVIIADSVEW